MTREAETIFHELADRSPAQRESYFKERQVPVDLRAEVEVLLRFDSGTGDCLTACVADSAQELMQASPGTKPCGPYRLTRVLGRGGMGSVYLAERADGEVEQRVAVKLLRYGGDEPAFLDRFLRERQILATLKHPGIARLLDAGHSSDGQPYLAMDYIEGIPIDVYAEGLDLRSKLGLFLQVCEAVSYAHRKLIVHRDIKPSNILVDASGEPKLLDFGIAKILDAAVDQTRTQERLLTPEYASPEQYRGAAPAATSDIYSLGAVLYKLLTGRSPHASASESREAIEFAICSTEPAPPSQVNAALSKDLDFIVGKALRKEPDERYSSVDILAEDVRAFLESRPVRARSGNVWYLTRKFLRRYWAPVAAAALVIASLSTGLYVANRQRLIAERRFGQLRQLSNKVLELDTAIRYLPGATEARQRLVSAALEYLEGLSVDARGDLGLAQEVGDLYYRVAKVQGVPSELNLGEFAKAEASLKKADAFIEMVLKSHPQDRRALHSSANVSHDRMILAQSEHRRADALSYARKSAERFDAFLRRGDAQESERVNAATCYGNIALAYVNMHLYAEAIPYARRSVQLAQPIPFARHTVGQGLSLLADALRYQGDLEGALQAIREARKTAEEAVYPDETRRMINLYGVLLREGLILGEDGGVNLDQSKGAIEPLQKAFDMSEEGARRDPSDSTSRGHVGNSGNALGNILRHRDPRRALAVYDLALRRLGEIRNSLKARRDQVLILANSSYALRSLHRAGEAKQRIDAAFSILKDTKDYPADRIPLDSEAYIALSALADYHAGQGDPRRAVEIYEQLLDKVMAAKPEPLTDLRDAPRLSRLYEALAGLYRQTGDTAKAEDMESRVLELWRQWERKLPNNAFVLRQLAAVHAH